MQFEIEKSRLLARMDVLASRLHPASFAKYKNAFAGKDVVLLATGPSLDKFRPIKAAIYVGVNAAFKYDKVKLDYFFMCDHGGAALYEALEDCSATKFYCIVEPRHRDHEQVIMTIPESIAIRHVASRFYENGCTDPLIQEELDFVYDITAHPLTNYCSVVHASFIAENPLA